MLVCRVLQGTSLPLLLLLSSCSAQPGSQNIESIECPLPGNPTSPTEEECATHTACSWTNGVCHMRKNREAGYLVDSAPAFNDRGFTTVLKKTDESVTLFGGDIPELLCDVIHHEDYHLQIKITDSSKARYEVPIPVSVPVEAAQDSMFDVTLHDVGEPLVINVTRKSNGNNILRQVGPLTYEDQFLQLSVRLASPHLYGFGENPHTSLLHQFQERATSAMFAGDQPIDEKEPHANHYGAFPYYVNIEDDEGNTHSVLLMNSNAMEYSTFSMADGSPALTLRAIGGIIDLHVFAGPTPEDVNRQFATAMGKAAFPPYWSLGFHLSRWGYNSTDSIRAVRDRMREAGIPQDVQVFDIDYMDHRRDFTYDPVNFGDLPQLIAELRDENIRTTVILDPAIAIKTDDYPTYTRGRDADAYVKWMSEDLVPSDQPPEADDYVVGRVWPDEHTTLPDFFNPATKSWWKEEIRMFREQVPFDALWIDMNEPANFNTNLDPSDLNCPDNALDSPPYPTLATSLSNNLSGRLSEKTICMSSAHTDGQKNYTHYDVHSLYGYSETVATYQALESGQPGLRPVVLSRSTFPGSGRYAVHWLGDNSATWEQMRMSIIGMIEFNMFGIPMVGADICGFALPSSLELCARWMQLGAFYPFSRNHNSLGEPDQDPAAWPEVAAISADVLTLRYRLLPTLYNLFHQAHMYGNSVIRPLFNVFPSDASSRSIDDQFMWGDQLMVAPVLQEGAVARDVYYPPGYWYRMDTGMRWATGPASATIDAPLEYIPVFVRGGSVLALQEPGLTTDQSRLNDFELLVALDRHSMASGQVFWDDGETEHVMTETFLADVLYDTDALVMTVSYNPAAAAGLNLSEVKILGVPSEPVEINVNGADHDNFTYDSISASLRVKLNVPLNEMLTILFTYQVPQ